MRITTLEPQATNPERINVYVDGQFLLGANAKVVLHWQSSAVLLSLPHPSSFSPSVCIGKSYQDRPELVAFCL